MNRLNRTHLAIDFPIQLRIYLHVHEIHPPPSLTRPHPLPLISMPISSSSPLVPDPESLNNFLVELDNSLFMPYNLIVVPDKLLLEPDHLP